MTKAQIKFIQSLSRQKYRKEHNAYLVEGDKNAKEWLQSDQRLHYIVASRTWLVTHEILVARHPEAEVLPAEDFELEKITSLQHAQEVVLVAEQAPPASFLQSADRWYLYLDKIQDPGNMGTIIRTADWFGIEQIICSPDCVEVYNPKVVQASMGSLLRVPVLEMSLEQLLRELTVPLYATSLSGQDIRLMPKAAGGIIAMGNESKGLSDELMLASAHQVLIPRLGAAESLNVAVATGIVCAALTLPG